MLHRLVCFLSVFCLAASLGSPARAGEPEQPDPVETTGTVIRVENVFDINGTLIRVLTANTRQGVRQFRITPSTLILLNNHAATEVDLLADEEILIEYRYPSFEATLIQIFREATARGRVTQSTATQVSVRIERRAVLNLVVNANSRLEVAGITITNADVLPAGIPVRIIYEPGSFLLLSLSAGAATLTNQITAVDVAARTITLAGRQPITLSVAAAATIRRNRQNVGIESLVVGDRVRAAVVQIGTTRTALAINVLQTAPPPTPTPTPTPASRARQG